MIIIDRLSYRPYDRKKFAFELRNAHRLFYVITKKIPFKKCVLKKRIRITDSSSGILVASTNCSKIVGKLTFIRN